MKKHCVVVTLAAFVLAIAVGCQQSAPTTPPAREKGTDIHIQTPRGNVDVEGKDNGKTNVGVDIHPKATHR